MAINRLCVYWDARQETSNECAQRLASYMSLLVDKYSSLGTWYQTGRKKAEANLNPVISSLNVLELQTLLEKGANRTDMGNQIIESLGFNVSLWNKAPERTSIGLSISCGLFERGMCNSVVMQLPRDSLQELGLDDNNLKLLLIDTAELWDADWGTVYDNRSEVFANASGEPFLDKMLWLNKNTNSSGKFAASTETTNKGIIYIC